MLSILDRAFELIGLFYRLLAQVLRMYSLVPEIGAGVERGWPAKTKTYPQDTISQEHRSGGSQFLPFLGMKGKDSTQ